MSPSAEGSQALHFIFESALTLARSSSIVSPVGFTRSEHLQKLLQLTGSDLERQWLKLLESRGHRLPSHAQIFIEPCKTRPDFLYSEHQVAIYIDGPHHRYPNRQARDEAQTECMEDCGYTVLRFRLEDDWESLLNRFKDIFGPAQSAADIQSVMAKPSEVTPLDLDLFEPVWHPLMSRLTALGIAVGAGADVQADGRVVGAYLASANYRGQTLYLVDQADTAIEAVVKLLQHQGYHVRQVCCERQEEDIHTIAHLLGAS
jgi:very-short-patch-repair endonuclease